MVAALVKVTSFHSNLITKRTFKIFPFPVEALPSIETNGTKTSEFNGIYFIQDPQSTANKARIAFLQSQEGTNEFSSNRDTDIISLAALDLSPKIILDCGDKTFTNARYIKSGGMAHIYKVTGNDGRIYAAKVIKPEFTESIYLERFKKEIFLMRLIKHPNIITFIGAGSYNDRPFLIMEYADGECLEKRLETNSINSNEFISSMASICHAVDHLHKKGFLHRDLKPSNILFLSNGTPKLCDFGVSANISNITQTGKEKSQPLMRLTSTNVTVGTLAYMAPEQAQKVLNPEKIEITKAVDRYAIGVILYEGLTGTLPLEDVGDGPVGFLRRLASNKRHKHIRTLVPNLNPELAEIIMRLLDKTPGFRLMGKDLKWLGNKLQHYIDSKLVFVN